MRLEARVIALSLVTGAVAFGPPPQPREAAGGGAALTCEHATTSAFPASSLIRFDAVAETADGATGTPARASRSAPLQDGRAGPRIARRARTFVYVELSDRASRVDVEPKLEGATASARMMEFGETAISTIQLSKVVQKICGGQYASSPMCQQVRARR